MDLHRGRVQPLGDPGVPHEHQASHPPEAQEHPVLPEGGGGQQSLFSEVL